MPKPSNVPQDLALGQLRHDRGRWRRSVKVLRDVARAIGDPAWRARYRAAAAQILSWRRQAAASRRLPNPISRRAAAVLRREFQRAAGDGIPQAAAWAIAYRYAQRKGLVE